MLQVPLGPADYVVAAFPFRDQVFIITRYGQVFRMLISEIDGLPTFSMLEEGK